MMTSTNVFDGGDFRYANYGGCGGDSVVVGFTLPTSFWQNVWISENTVIMDAGTERNGLITKRFNLKTGTSGDRLAVIPKSRSTALQHDSGSERQSCRSGAPSQDN